MHALSSSASCACAAASPIRPTMPSSPIISPIPSSGWTTRPWCGALRVAAWATTFACLLVLLQFLAMRPLHLLYTQPLPVQRDAIIMAVFSTALPIWMIAEAVSRIGSGRTAIVGLLGPAVTLLLAWIVLGQAPGWLQLAGAVLVIGGVHQVSDARAAT